VFAFRTRVTCNTELRAARGDHRSHNIELWELGLEGTGKGFVRMTHFNDYEGWKASNPVVSTDGNFMAFQVASTKDEAGVGYGLFCLVSK
jgi:hypothetical protein